MKELQYFVRVFWSKEDQCYIAEVPELKGCSGLGKSPELAFKEAQRSIQGWIEVAQKNKVPIPRPMVHENISRLNLRLPSDVVRRVKMSALEHGMSINQYMMKLLMKTA